MRLGEILDTKSRATGYDPQEIIKYITPYDDDLFTLNIPVNQRFKSDTLIIEVEEIYMQFPIQYVSTDVNLVVTYKNTFNDHDAKWVAYQLNIEGVYTERLHDILLKCGFSGQAVEQVTTLSSTWSRSGRIIYRGSSLNKEARAALKDTQ